jgi:hypothetical protein
MAQIKNIRNVAIILLIALAVDLIPGGGDAADTLREALYLAFLGALAWGASRLYREHRMSLYSLGDRNRAVLYISLAVITVALIAKARMWETVAGEFVWIVLVVGAVLAIVETVRAARSY